MRSISPEGLTTRATANRGLSQRRRQRGAAVRQCRRGARGGHGRRRQAACRAWSFAASSCMPSSTPSASSRNKPVTLTRGDDQFTADSLDYDNLTGVANLQRPGARRAACRRPRARPGAAMSSRADARWSSSPAHRAASARRWRRASTRPATGWRWWRGARPRSRPGPARQGMDAGRYQIYGADVAQIDSIVAAGAGLHRAPGPARRGDRQRRHQRRHGHRGARGPRRDGADLRHQQRRPGRHLPSLRRGDGGARQRPAGGHRQRRRHPRPARATAPTAPARPAWSATARACAANCAPAASRW